MGTKSTILMLLGIAVASLAHAASPTVPAAQQTVVTKAVQALSPDTEVESISTSPVAGFDAVVGSGEVYYVSTDGRFVMQGNLYDLKQVKNVTLSTMAASRQALVATIPQSERIVFSPPHPTKTLVAFVDFDCPYCREMVDHINDYLAKGIRLEFVSWPRSGRDSPSYFTAVNVWCAKDRKAAFLAAFAGKKVPEASCANPIGDQMGIAAKLDMPGTPGVLTENGQLIGGYVAPDKLGERLALLDPGSAGKESQ